MERIFKTKSIQTKILGIVLLSIFLITAVLGYLSFNFSKTRLISMIGDSSKGIAITVASFINGDDIISIRNNIEKIKEKRLAAISPTYSNVYEKIKGAEGVEPADLVMKNYMQYMQQLAGVKKANNIESPINVYISDQNRLKLVLSSDEATSIGALYTMRPEAEKAIVNNAPQSTGIYRDKDGIWISAYAPISFPSSKFNRAVVEINYKIDLFINKLKKELALILLVCLLGFLGTAALSYGLVDRLVSAINKLDKAAKHLEEEDYDVHIEAMTDDEIGHLAQTFEKLRLSIRKKIDELKSSLIQEKKTHLESIIALSNAIDLRDPYTRKHLNRVEKYALLIAKAMHLSPDEIDRLRYGCYLHDIGKLYIEDAILKKPHLSDSDVTKIRKHPESGAKILEGIPFFEKAKDIILYHQEHYDGTGYPKGLKGKEIPFLARIVAVADAFDAMTSDRPYKSKISFKEAMDRIEKDAGKQFDPDVCKVFLKYRNVLEKIARKHF